MPRPNRSTHGAPWQRLLATGAALLLIAGPSLANHARAASDAETAKQILSATGIQGGLVVHLGCADGRLTAALRADQRYQVHGLDADVAQVQAARQHIQGRGLYGPVSVDQLTGNRLPYVDNMVNLVVSEDLGDVSMQEVTRVLAPHGVAYIRRDGKWTKTIKPRPDNIDEWTHYMHDASGNAVAHDMVVGPPRHLQWLGSPRWSRHHDRMASMSALVSAGGRIFYIMDEGSRVSIQLPPKWTLVARDAFNGTVLWKRPIDRWNNHLWPLKSGATQLARRLVATGDRVYITLGLEAPLTAIDAATGKTITTYDETRATEELVKIDNILLALVNTGTSELANFAPVHNTGDQRRVAEEFSWNGKPRYITAIDSDTGKILWKQHTAVAPLTLVGDKKHVLFHDGEKIVCLRRSDGERLWSSLPAARRPKITMNFGPRLVLYNDVVLFAGGDRSMRAYAIDSGEPLWTAPHGRSGYQSPEDLLVVAGLVWSAPTTSTRDSGIFTGRDPKTGEVKVEFPPDVETYWFHHRCYIAKATDRFLMPSRTGIELVDFEKQNWDINHWVRGGCLYGVMPCNGLIYAPPHNCACYPEAKLYGLNALAASATSWKPETEPGKRLEKGPAFGSALGNSAGPEDWPTYRRDAARSGFATTDLPAAMKSAWETDLGGNLSSVVVADGRLFVADIDRHQVHALDASSGAKLWSYTVGGRVDSPPTIDRGRVLFGATDGNVYCLRARDGELVWRFRAAPADRRLMAFEQLESVWPVHGSVLVHEGAAYFVAGRSNFLDGGMHWFKIDPETGEELAYSKLDELDPESGENLQSRIKILNMPVALPDILSCDGKYVYMRSQKFDFEGTREELGPHSGVPAEQGGAQGTETAHLFAPMGFLDSTWFHRSYWIYGRSFAGGHGGYYQAGKYTPAGRILVSDGKSVYGFGRKPQYLKWTTTLEHQLFAADKEAPAVEATARAGGGGTMVRFEKTPSIDPTGKSITVEAWVRSDTNAGVVLARGGPTRGYALAFRNGRPRFVARIQSKIYAAVAKQNHAKKWIHLVGVLDEKRVRLFIDGELAATTQVPGLIQGDPAQSLEIGADDGGPVGNYNSPSTFSGLIDQVNVYHSALDAEAIAARFANPNPPEPGTAGLVLSCSFDNGKAADASGLGNHGTIQGAQPAPGKVARALRFAGRGGGNRGGGSFVKPRWTQDLPMFVRSMVLAGDQLVIAGPPDVMDEEKTFQRLVARDPTVAAKLAEQEDALGGKAGGLLQVISTKDGSRLAEYKLSSLPTWDGMAAANGRLYLSTTDGKVVCFADR